ncbi:MAG TPA: FGGY family carbohydrate kinase [Acidimicrobiales bacterium]|nr:FGGY family carbohydrate kinase [Acidimicrobiales bacterium]
MTTGRSLFVGIDVGTTLTKAGVVDLEGTEVAQAAVPTIWQREATGGHARPDDLFAGAVAAVSEVLDKVPAGDVLGVGVTSLAETAVLVDRAGSTVGPAIAWFDRRAADDLAELKSEFGTERFGRATGLGTAQIPTIATLRWLMRNVADARRATCVLSVADWVVSRLGGDSAAELSLASRTGALSVPTRQWWAETLDWAGVRRTIFPEVRSAGAFFGRAHDLPCALERLEGTVLTVAGHDHPCASVGIGVTKPSQVMDDCGTAEALVRAVPMRADLDLAAGIPFGIMVGCHVLPRHYCLMGGFPFGLDLVEVLEQCGVTSRHGLSDLDEPALALGLPQARVMVGPTGLPQVPSPIGGQISAGPERAWWTAMASAVARSRWLLDGLERLGGPIAEVRMSGGWSRNPLLTTLKSEVFPTLSYPVVKEAGTRGAALLASLAAGAHGDVAEFPGPQLELISPRSLGTSATTQLRARPAAPTPT